MATLLFDSTRFGEKIEVDEEALITLDILGFPQQRYVLIDYEEPFSWLHSVDNSKLAFIVFDGGNISAQYDVSTLKHSNIDFKEQEDEYAMLILVTIKGELASATCNLKAPIFINLRNRLGCQLVFDSAELNTRTALIDVLPYIFEVSTGEQKDENVEVSDNIGSQGENLPADKEVSSSKKG